MDTAHSSSRQPLDACAAQWPAHEWVWLHVQARQNTAQRLLAKSIPCGVLDIGTVDMAERCQHHQPPHGADVEAAIAMVEDAVVPRESAQACDKPSTA